MTKLKLWNRRLLIAPTDPYNPGTVLLEVAPTPAAGQYIDSNITLDKGIYRLTMAGDGAGGGGLWVGRAYFPGGGSGAAWDIEIELSGNYRYQIGRGGASGTSGSSGGAGFGSYFYVNVANPALFLACQPAGPGIWYGGAGAGGLYQSSDSANNSTKKVYQASNGNPGVSAHSLGPVAGGASVYQGYGQGGSSLEAGGAGYLKITYLRQ